MADGMDEWIIINDPLDNTKQIGAIGFLNGKATVVASFYESSDGNRDGSTGWGEWAAFKLSPLSLDNMAVTEVAMAAKHDMRVLRKDAGFVQMANNLFTSFATGLIADGIYAVYFSRGISGAAKGIAGVVVQGTVKQFVVRKGMETAVKRAYQSATH